MVLTRARKRAIESQQPAPVKKRKQSHLDTPKKPARTPKKDPPPENPPPGGEVNEGDPVAYWVQESVWPYAYIKPDPNAEKMSRILAKQKPGSRKRSEPSSMGSETGD